MFPDLEVCFTLIRISFKLVPKKTIIAWKQFDLLNVLKGQTDEKLNFDG